MNISSAPSLSIPESLNTNSDQTNNLHSPVGSDLTWQAISSPPYTQFLKKAEVCLRLSLLLSVMRIRNSSFLLQSVHLGPAARLENMCQQFSSLCQTLTTCPRPHTALSAITLLYLARRFGSMGEVGMIAGVLKAFRLLLGIVMETSDCLNLYNRT